MTMTLTRPFLGSLALAVLSLLSSAALAQSTVGELLGQGGKQLSKADILDLVPLRYQAKWPNGQGEEELVFTEDGKITGKGYHYGSRSDSPASGQWKVEDDGKVCTPKTFTAWNSSTNSCWYLYQLNGAHYATGKTDGGSKIGKVNTLEKLAKQ